MGRMRGLTVDGMKKGEWTADEDMKLVAYIKQNGRCDWRSLPQRAGLKRCGKSCRLRWLNYMQPGLKRGKFNPEEEEEIIKLHALLGNRWAAIAKQMPNRTDNDIKNHWNSCLKKRLIRKGIDPMTHEPFLTVDATSRSSTTTSSSSTGSSRFLNKLAAGISSKKHKLDMIKTVICSEQPRQAIVGLGEKSMMISTEEEEVLMEIDKINLSTTSFDELLQWDSIMSLDDFSSTDSYQADIFDDTQLSHMFLL